MQTLFDLYAPVLILALVAGLVSGYLAFKPRSEKRHDDQND